PGEGGSVAAVVEMHTGRRERDKGDTENEEWLGAYWERIQSIVNLPRSKMYTRQEMVDMNARAQFAKLDKSYLKTQQRKRLEKLKLKEQEKKEYFNQIAADERELQKQDTQKMIDKANLMRFHQNGCVRKFNSALQRTYVQKENEALIKYQQEKQRIAREQRSQPNLEMIRESEEAQRREQEDACKKQLHDRALAAFWTEQIKEKRRQREKKMQQEKEESDQLRNLDELPAQELKNQAQREQDSKKMYLRHMQEQMSSRKLQRETEAQILDKEEEVRQRHQLDKEQMLQQQKEHLAEKFRKRQVPIKTVTDKYAVRMREQDAARAQRELEISEEMAKQDAEVAKQQKEREEKRAAMLKDIYAHREAMIDQKKQKAKAEKETIQNCFQAQKEADRLFLEKQMLEAQRKRENNKQCQIFNDNLAALKHAHYEKLKREEHDAEVRDAEQAAARKKQLQDYIQSEIDKAAASQRNAAVLLAVRTGGHGFLSDGEEPGNFIKDTSKTSKPSVLASTLNATTEVRPLSKDRTPN
uniref:Trichohyalin-plectin-homology domain-containing protein n=1 Tax=Mastacembelus armatus TaxID=205130 RepID=A0A3Q3MYR5_9TELE